jgi:hypothetical protein
MKPKRSNLQSILVLKPLLLYALTLLNSATASPATNSSSSHTLRDNVVSWFESTGKRLLVSFVLLIVLLALFIGWYYAFHCWSDRRAERDNRKRERKVEPEERRGLTMHNGECMTPLSGGEEHSERRGVD